MKITTQTVCVLLLLLFLSSRLVYIKLGEMLPCTVRISFFVESGEWGGGGGGGGVVGVGGADITAER